MSGASICFAASLFLLAAGEVPGEYADSVLAQDPIAYYRFNTGNVGLDEVSGVPNAAIGTPVTGVAGPSSPAFLGFEADNAALQFDHNHDASLVGFPTGLNMRSSLGSVSFWFKVRPDQLTSDGSIMFYGSDSTNGDGFNGQNELHVHIWGTGSNAGKLGVWIEADPPYTPVSGTAHGAGNLADDTWHHLALTWDRDNAGDDAARLYVDGSQVLYLSPHDAHDFPFSSRLRLGKPGIAPHPRMYDGQLDEVAMFNHLLTPAEVVQQYSAASIPEPSTVLLLSMGAVGLLAYAWRKRRRG